MSKLTDDILLAASSLPPEKRQAFLEALAEEIGTATQKARERVAPGSAERETFKNLLRPAVTLGPGGVPMLDRNLAHILYDQEAQAALRLGKRPPSMDELTRELANELYDQAQAQAAQAQVQPQGGGNGE